MREPTWSEQITQWQTATFGVPDSHDALLRAEEEWEELISMPGEEGVLDVDVALEAADVVVCLAAYVRALGYDLAELVERKLAVNRARTWAQDADGVWRHVK